MREVRRGLESKHQMKQVQMKTWDCSVCDLAGPRNRSFLEKVRVGKGLKQQFGPRSGKWWGRRV